MGKQLKIFFGIVMLIQMTASAQNTGQEMKTSFAVNSEVFDYPKVQWIKGDPLITFEQDKIYIIECWATWCGPCIGSIPHLNALSKRFKDKIIFVGQNVWEDNKERVEEFVNDRGEEMGYRIAFGGGDESDFVNKWLKAANLSSIPQTFVVQDNKVVWITHPASLSEGNLQLLIDKEFSIPAAESMSPLKKAWDADSLLQNDQIVEAGNKIDEALKMYPGLSFGIYLKLQWFRKQGKQEEALAYAKKLYSNDPENNKFIYYDELLQAKQYTTLASLLDKEILKKPEDISVVMMRYQVFCMNDDYSNAAILIKKAAAATNDLAELTRLSLIDKYVSGFKAHPETDEAMLKAGQMVLSLEPGHYNVAIAVAERLWKLNNEKDNARSVLKEAIGAPKKNKEKLDKVLELILASLNKDRFPDEKQIREWEDLAFQEKSE